MQGDVLWVGLLHVLHCEKHARDASNIAPGFVGHKDVLYDAQLELVLLCDSLGAFSAVKNVTVKSGIHFSYAFINEKKSSY